MSTHEGNLPCEGDSDSGGDNVDFYDTPTITTGINTKEPDPELNKRESVSDTKKDPHRYNLEGWKQGIIFNQEKFEPRFGLSTRYGTHHDVNSITKTFKSLGWLVDVYTDLTVSGIRQVMEDWSAASDECVALSIFILTHGESNNILMAFDNKYNFRGTIQTPLLPDFCPGLKEKPKMIFIQVKRSF